MKNIYILQTDKPSRLKQNTITKKLSLVNKGIDLTSYTAVNIYITSDEEIKEGDWACHTCITNDKYQIIRCNIQNNVSIQEHWNKIILTTDQDLINDGVQVIDDEFLEWFVKNPSCEEVEFFKDFFQVNQNNPVLKGSTALAESYKIIIPKEEPTILMNESDYNTYNEIMSKYITKKK
jgi:hypothetical protein